MDVSGPEGKKLQPMINFCPRVIAYSSEISVRNLKVKRYVQNLVERQTFFVKCLCHWSRKLE